MSIDIGPPQGDELTPRITVIGVGGGGGNAIANMIAANVEGVDFIVANTDAQALSASPAERRIQLGTHITQGLGAGSHPEVGRAAAEETIAQVEEALDGAHMCFIAAGMGGGTGTGAAPVIAKAARDKGILTVGVVTKPFSFEGPKRMRSAEAGIAELQDHVDTLIVIPNQNLFLVANPNTTFRAAFELADEVLQQGVRGITDLMVMPGLINLDFADVRSVMREMGKAMMGTGEAEGDGRALEAAQKAINNPLLDGVSMAGAKGVIISITGGQDMRLMEVDEAANHIRELVDPDANIIFGSAFNDALEGRIRVSVVATGIEGAGASDAAAAPATRSFAFQPASAAVPVAADDVYDLSPATEAEPVSDPDEPAMAGDDDDGTDMPQASDPALTPAPGFAALDGEAATDEPEADDADDDALVLGSDDAPPAPDGGADAALPPPASLGSALRSRLASASGGDSAGNIGTAGAAGSGAMTGGTLFERMSRLSRGNPDNGPGDGDGSDPGGPDNDGGPDIPKFLGRQNNQ